MKYIKRVSVTFLIILILFCLTCYIPITTSDKCINEYPPYNQNLEYIIDTYRDSSDKCEGYTLISPRKSRHPI